MATKMDLVRRLSTVISRQQEHQTSNSFSGIDFLDYGRYRYGLGLESTAIYKNRVLRQVECTVDPIIISFMVLIKVFMKREAVRSNF